MQTLSHNQEILLTRQRHEADRAGLHFDYRIVVGDRAYSWATKKDLPEPGQSVLLHEQPIHAASYALSKEVIIPKGQYGSGITKLEFVQKGKISNPEESSNKFVIQLNNGQRFLLKHVPGYSEKAWLFKNLTSVDNKYLEKISAIFTHATNKDSLNKILESGKIKSVSQIARDNPSVKLKVEHKDKSLDRKELKAGDADGKMTANGKEPDKIFLTRDGYLPAYGNHVIVKELSDPVKVRGKDSHPNEYTTRRAISVNDSATVYVPKSTLKDWEKKYPKVDFLPKDRLGLEALEANDAEKKPLMKKIAMLLTQYHHSETGKTIWVKEKELPPKDGWTKTKHAKYIKRKT